MSEDEVLLNREHNNITLKRVSRHLGVVGKAIEEGAPVASIDAACRSVLNELQAHSVAAQILQEQGAVSRSYAKLIGKFYGLAQRRLVSPSKEDVSLLQACIDKEMYHSPPRVYQPRVSRSGSIRGLYDDFLL